MRVFFEKCLLNTSGEAKNLRHYQKPCFFVGTSFQKAVIFDQDRVLKKKKNTHPDLSEVVLKKI